MGGGKKKKKQSREKVVPKHSKFHEQILSLAHTRLVGVQLQMLKLSWNVSRGSADGRTLARTRKGVGEGLGVAF